MAETIDITPTRKGYKRILKLLVAEAARAQRARGQEKSFDDEREASIVEITDYLEATK